MNSPVVGAFRQNLIRLLRNGRLRGQESWQLAKACAGHAASKAKAKVGGGSGASSSSPSSSTTTLKDVFLRQASPPHGNRLAAQFLLAEREWSLLRYYGLQQYGRRLLDQTRAAAASGGGRSLAAEAGAAADTTTAGTSAAPAASAGVAASSAGDAASSSTAANGTGGKKAKVAFMVTAQMKQELTGELRYTAAQVRLLTPVEASLILEHRVDPAEAEARLPALVEMRERELEEAAKEAAALAAAEAEEREREAAEAAKVAAEDAAWARKLEEQQMQSQTTREGATPVGQSAPSSPSLSSPSPKSNLFDFSGYASRNQLDDVTTAVASAGGAVVAAARERTLWYELVEISDDSYRLQAEPAMNRSQRDGGDEDEESFLVQAAKAAAKLDGKKGGDGDNSGPQRHGQVIGLYRSLSDAREAMEIKREFSSRRSDDLSFEIRESLR